MEPNTNEATAPKRLKTGGKKPIIIIGVIVAVLLAAYVGLCAYANSLDIFYPNTTINGVDVAGLTAEQAAERLRQEIPEETVEFYLPLADETGDGESAPEGDMLYGADPDAVCTYRELGITEELDYEVSAQSAFDAVQGRSSFFVKGWEYLACLVGADGQLGVVLEPEEDIFQVKMEQLSEQFSREAQDASYEVTEDAVEITKALNGLSVSAADLARTVQERWTGSGNGAAASVFVNNARILPAKTLTAQEIYDDCSGEVKNASYDKETESIVPEQAGADFDVDEAQKMLDAAEPGETITVPAEVELPAVTAEELEQVLFRDVLGEARTHVGGTSARRSNVKLSAAAINGYVMNTGDVFSYNEVVGQRTAARGYKAAPAYVQGETVDEIGGGIPGGKKFKAAQTGGPSGGCIPASLIDTPIDYESLSAIGSMMGSGGLIVMDEDNCMVDIAKFYLEFIVDESCGKCSPCRIGTKRLLDLLTKITEGNGEPEDLDTIEELCHHIKQSALCGLGQTAPNPVLSTLTHFREEFEAHIYEKRCPAGVCKALIQYIVDPTKCKGCTRCAQGCPTGAISGAVRAPHIINQSKCIKCGACMDHCRFDAIYKQ